MHVFAFIDTNVLMHYEFFKDVDWANELRVPEVTLVFAPVVFSELDKRKWAGTRREKARAKTIIKALDDLGLSVTPVCLRDGVFAIAIDAEPPEVVFTAHRLEPQVNDDRLLASLLSFRELHASDRVLIITADAGLRMKARSRGIEISVPDERLELPEEPDDTERELAETKRELTAIKNAAPKLRLTIAGESHMEWNYVPVRALGDAVVKTLQEQWRTDNPGVASPFRSIHVAGQTYSIPDITSVMSGQTAESAAEYNESVELKFKDYEQYLRKWPAVVDSYSRIVELNFVIENTGTAPADDVDLLISTQARGSWLAKWPEIPQPPCMPRRRSPFDFMADLHRRSIELPVFDSIGPVTGPDIPDDKSVVEYHAKRVKHHVPCALKAAYFQFGPDAAVQSFTISYRLVAANIREPQSGTVHVKVSLAEAQDPPLPETSGHGDDT